jgi:6-phosphofructokinase 1
VTTVTAASDSQRIAKIHKSVPFPVMKKVAVLTSGGDAPGMNAAIRAVVRTGIAQGWQMFGVQNGFAGLVAGSIMPLGLRDVGGIIQRGGTILGSTRCPEFKEDHAQNDALGLLRDLRIEALVIIGGSGSQKGAYALAQKGFPVVGVASTIDNDLFGSEMTIGVDTALNVALEAVDRLKVTASSHHRAFLVEVMGRDCGYLALMTGIAGGAEAIVIPEMDSDPEEIAQECRVAYERGKAHALVVVAEGAKYNAERMAAYFEAHRERLGFELRVTKLGHVQRGGTPDVFDRLLATRLGAGAVAQMVASRFGVMVGWQRGTVETTCLDQVVARTKPLDPKLIQLARVLAR